MFMNIIYCFNLAVDGGGLMIFGGFMPNNFGRFIDAHSELVYFFVFKQTALARETCAGRYLCPAPVTKTEKASFS